MILTDDQKLLIEETNLPLFLLIEAEELNSDDENDASVESEEEVAAQQPEVNADGVPGGVDEEGNQLPPPPTEEEIFNAEMEGSEDKFIQFVLYDKLSDLSSKITILKDNIKNDSSSDRLELIQKLDHYEQYLNVLNELIFSVSTSVIYKIVGQIELELIDLLEIYNAELEKNAAIEKNKKG